MKKILIPLLLFFTVSAQAQFNNSWIDYSKTYYKFKRSADLLCRIPQSALTSINLAGTNADNFQLWRNGEQVRLFTSVTGAPLGTNDFIEFWGVQNDGKSDFSLYRSPEFQLADKYSLATDTVSYFLTVNAGAGNLRFTAATNTSPSANAPEPYFFRTVDFFPRSRINPGFAQFAGEYVYSSSYDDGEGWTTNEIVPANDFVLQLTGLNVYTQGPANSLSVRVNAFGNAPNQRRLRVKFNSDSIYGSPMNFLSQNRAIINNLPLSSFQNPNTASISVGQTFPGISTQDRIVVATISLTYPATFNFNNEKNFYFELQPATSESNIVIDNFNTGGLAPVLLDFTTGRRYIGDITSTSGKVKFVVPASSALRKFQLASLQLDNLALVQQFEQRNFVNYSAAAQQGDYLVISHPALYGDGNATNYVEQYSQYRASQVGGGFNTKIININEITDQFAFGITKHPEAIRNFLLYGNSKFSVKPKYVFLIGRGLDYTQRKRSEGIALANQQDFVPTFGWPASDNLLASNPGVIQTVVPIGRLSVISPQEINAYFIKVKEYEAVQRSSSPLIAEKAWMKNGMHIAGGGNEQQNSLFRFYMDSYKNILEDTLYGARIESFSKTTSGPVQEASSQRINELFAEGLGTIAYFGHSSASVFEFNLSNPELYNNAGKYPFFTASGCNAGNFYIFDPLRNAGNLTLSEKYVLANQRGSIAFLASTHFGIPNNLDIYNIDLYLKFGKSMYGNSLGNQIKQLLSDLGGGNPALDYYQRFHLEEISLHGDPAIYLNNFAKPDYAIEAPLIKIDPSIITVADANFSLDIKMRNLGKATNDSIWVSVKRKLPNDSIIVLYNRLIPAIKNTDSISLIVPVNPATGKGLNQIIVSLDYTNRVSELYENNNEITKDFFIFEDELRPVFPYDYSIQNKANITYWASTANPLSGIRSYVMELDTTANFNSPFKKIYNQTGVAGAIQFIPTNVTYVDSTVYYWRVAIVPVGTNTIIYNNASFVYLPSSGPGFNQSHYFQHLKSKYTNITLDIDRKFKFNTNQSVITIRTGLFPHFDFDKINVNVGSFIAERYGCRYNSLQFYVFDPATLQLWDNRNVSATNGLYGSETICTDPTRKFFEYRYNTTTAARKAAMDFIDLVPSGMYIGITNLGWETTNSTFIDTWKNDQATLGTGNSLYHKLKSIGFNAIDSFTRNLPFMYFYKKGSTTFTPVSAMGTTANSYIEQRINVTSSSVEGTIESPVYGPAKEWTSLHWRGTTTDPAPRADVVKVQVFGIAKGGAKTFLATMAPAQDTSLGFIDPKVYPFVQFKMLTSDTLYATPNQLKYLRVNASYVPEGAIAPNIFYSFTDTIVGGQNLDFSVAFKNVSTVAFDSFIKTRIIITDRNNVARTVNIAPRKALVAGDTLIVSYSIPSQDFIGNNTLFVEFNPDNHQPEQYHFNNILFKNFFVNDDKFNPLLDVTFDAVHILNRDIVSARPTIIIKLKDENKFLTLKDTSLLKVQVRFPDSANTLRTYYFNDILRFTPATGGGNNNTATIEFTPTFTLEGEYELLVTGKDVNGNRAGDLDYKIAFNVISKPMISNFLNYPNPFTTSTAFLFTITGAEVPQNIRIQILTVTGKIVREITKDELGPLHIGRNITEFKWDGTDAFGQKLANGVYLYRVLTNLNGASLEKYSAPGDETNKFFNKGYGKMYLMR